MHQEMFSPDQIHSLLPLWAVGDKNYTDKAHYYVHVENQRILHPICNRKPGISFYYFINVEESSKCQWCLKALSTKTPGDSSGS